MGVKERLDPFIMYGLTWDDNPHSRNEKASVIVVVKMSNWDLGDMGEEPYSTVKFPR